MSNKIIEAADLPDAKKVYLRKDFLGWRVVQPLKNPDGSINWFNVIFGGKKNLFMLIVLIIALAILYFGVNELISNYKLIAAEPCKFCIDCHTTILNYTTPSLNFSSIKEVVVK